MKYTFFLAAAALAVASPTIAQELNSNSGSNADANSGSVSGAAANGNQQGQSQANIGGNNAGIGNSRSASESNSDSSSASFSGAKSDQSQSSDNRINTATSQTQGQSASNMQGTVVSNTFNSTPLKRQYIGTNTAVPLAASSSFSSDYCGGTVSGGASVAPIGVSLGASGVKYDDSCRYLRIADKAGIVAANWHNMGQEEMAYKVETFGTWAMCMAGPRAKNASENAAMQACLALGLMGTGSVPSTPPQASVAPEQAVTPQEAVRAAQPQPDYSNLPPKTPRGEADMRGVPTIPSAPVADMAVVAPGH